eukprot:2969203-Rhodomonas_salina.6
MSGIEIYRGATRQQSAVPKCDRGTRLAPVSCYASAVQFPVLTECMVQPGSVLNKHSMDEYKNTFRVATTEAVSLPGNVWEGINANSLFVFKYKKVAIPLCLCHARGCAISLSPHYERSGTDVVRGGTRVHFWAVSLTWRLERGSSQYGSGRTVLSWYANCLRAQYAISDTTYRYNSIIRLCQ